MLKVRAPAMAAEDVLRRFARGERPFLLDGGGEAALGRYSYAGCDPDDGVVWKRGDAGDPFRLLADAQRRWSIGPVDEHWPIAVGWVSYELSAARLAEANGMTLRATDDLQLPGIDFARYRAIWRHDRQTGDTEVLAHDSAAAERLLARLQRAPLPLVAANAGVLQPVWGRAEHEARVTAALAALRDGEVSRLVLAERMAMRLEDDAALGLYLSLRKATPAPLGAYLRSGGITILSYSDERLLRVETARIDGRWMERLLSSDETIPAAVGTRTGAELFAAILPAAIGAPRLEAMQLVDALEGRARGLYGGALGWLGAGRALDLAMPVRTAIVRGGELVLPVAANLVASSTVASAEESIRAQSVALAHLS